MPAKKTNKKHAIKKLPVAKGRSIRQQSTLLYTEITKLIEESRSKVYKTVNTELTLLNWQIGYLINRHILQESRASYGEQIVATVSQQLTKKFGNGYTYTALTRIIAFAREFEDSKI